MHRARAHVQSGKAPFSFLLSPDQVTQTAGAQEAGPVASQVN